MEVAGIRLVDKCISHDSAAFIVEHIYLLTKKMICEYPHILKTKYGIVYSI